MVSKYRLRATNEQGAAMWYQGETIKEVLRLFDSEYHRKGFIISIYDRTGDLVKRVKRSFR